MIRALLVDDERLALRQLEALLNTHYKVTIIEACTEPLQALEVARVQKPDVVFLDIHMPEMNGMRAAEYMQQACPGVDIVFVTAYDNYALEAFELNALDYVLKPIQKVRLDKTMRRLEERISRFPEVDLAAGSEARIQTFASLAYDAGSGALQPFRWRTAKAQELFAYLLHHRSRTVSKDVLLELLWPDFEPKKASTHLYTTIYQVRQCLKQSGLDLQIHNVSGGEGYSLDLNQVKLDVTEWETCIRELGPVGAQAWQEHQRLFDLYGGEYLGNCDYIWAESERERLRTIWLHHSSQLARSYAEGQKVAEAVTIYKRLIELHPYYENGYFGLMMLYDQIGDWPAVETCFRELQVRLVKELGVKLSPEVWSWYRSWPYASQE